MSHFDESIRSLIRRDTAPLPRAGGSASPASIARQFDKTRSWLPLVLACTCSLRPQPLWAAVAEAAFLAERNFWLLMLLAEVLCILMLAIFIHQLGRSRPRIEGETNVSVSSNKFVRFIREAVEQLNEVAAQHRSTTMSHNSCPAGQRGDDGRGGVKGRAELPEATRHGIEDINLARFEAKLRKLTELTKRLHEERKALGTDSMAATRYYLPFDLGGEQLAVSALSVYRVLLATQLVAEPSMPTNIRRAIKLHGTLVPVIDLGTRLGRQPIEIGRDTRIVILDISKGESLPLIGVLADAVGKVAWGLISTLSQSPGTRARVTTPRNLGDGFKPLPIFCPTNYALLGYTRK